MPDTQATTHKPLIRLRHRADPQISDGCWDSSMYVYISRQQRSAVVGQTQKMAQRRNISSISASSKSRMFSRRLRDWTCTFLLLHN